MNPGQAAENASLYGMEEERAALIYEKYEIQLAKTRRSRFRRPSLEGARARAPRPRGRAALGWIGLSTSWSTSTRTPTTCSTTSCGCSPRRTAILRSVATRTSRSIAGVARTLGNILRFEQDFPGHTSHSTREELPFGRQCAESRAARHSEQPFAQAKGPRHRS